MGQILAFVSGKGGTGKTSLCAAAASCLGAMGDKVLCIDMDIGLRNLDISLGMENEPLLPFTSFIDGTYTLEQLKPAEKLPNLYLLTAPVSATPEEIDGEALRKFFAECRENFDWCFLDAPAGIGAGFRLCAESADRFVVVTGGDTAALRDGAKAAVLLPEDVPAQVVVNRVDKYFFRLSDRTVDDVMDTVGLPLLGIVPEDEIVPGSAAKGIPLVLAERTGAAAAALRIARRLKEIKTPIGRI